MCEMLIATNVTNITICTNVTSATVIIPYKTFIPKVAVMNDISNTTGTDGTSLATENQSLKYYRTALSTSNCLHPLLCIPCSTVNLPLLFSQSSCYLRYCCYSKFSCHPSGVPKDRLLEIISIIKTTTLSGRYRNINITNIINP